MNSARTCHSHIWRKVYSDRIIVCDLEILHDKTLSVKEKRSKVWTESRCRLPEPMNGMGVILMKRTQLHIFGGYNGKKELGYHRIYDIRDILKDRIECKVFDVPES